MLYVPVSVAYVFATGYIRHPGRIPYVTTSGSMLYVSVTALKYCLLVLLCLRHSTKSSILYISAPDSVIHVAMAQIGCNYFSPTFLTFFTKGSISPKIPSLSFLILGYSMQHTVSFRGCFLGTPG